MLKTYVMTAVMKTIIEDSKTLFAAGDLRFLLIDEWTYNAK